MQRFAPWVEAGSDLGFAIGGRALWFVSGHSQLAAVLLDGRESDSGCVQRHSGYTSG